MKRVFLSIAVAVFLCVFLPFESRGAMYKYVDKNGNVGIVDDITKVPEEYRSQVDAREAGLKKEKPPAPPPTKEQAEELLKNLSANPAPQALAAKPVDAYAQSKPATLTQKISAALDRPGLGVGLRIIIAVAAVVAIFLIIGKLSEMAGAKKAGILICLLLSGAVIVFLMRASMQKAADRLAGVKNEVEGVKARMGAQQETAQKFVNDFDREQDGKAAASGATMTLTLPLPPKE